MNLIQELHERGCRVTAQRAIIISAIESLSAHITADEIFKAVKKNNPYISLATVYRTLDLLKEAELITESNMGGSTMHYALKTHGPHHHAVCRKCNQSIELPSLLFTPIIEQLKTNHNFILEADHMVLFGICWQCQKEADE
ncbi:transcriptional repressor [Anaerolineales bacterium HSG6]|nr:transcriptional repressor [Anaerolineales bacterium HSG6]MDM8533008.1 transcriptional repressor [Anaerolineales bacterium HSG25]